MTGKPHTMRDRTVLLLVNGMSAEAAEAFAIQSGADLETAKQIVAEARKRITVAADYTRDEQIGRAVMRLDGDRRHLFRTQVVHWGRRGATRMSRQYAPKTFLRQIRPEQFRRYFKQLGITPSVDLELLKRPNVEPAYQWIQSLPPEVCRRVESDFTTVCEMATEQGTQAILRAARDYGQDWSKILGDDHNHYERAFFAFLFHRSIFDLAMYYEEMDRIGGGRWHRRFVGVGLKPNTTNEAIGELADQMRRSYAKEGRGRHCHIDYYRRSDPDRHCFFAYPEDFAGSDLGYSDDGVLSRRQRRPAIEVIFVYRPGDGMLEIVAPGGQGRVEDLAAAFCITVLGLDELPPESQKATVNLQVLLSRSFTFPTDISDGIDTVNLRQLRLNLPGNRKRSITLTAQPSLYNPDAVLDLIDEVIDKAKVNLNQVTVTHARINVRFHPADKPRGKRVGFTVSPPHHCTLKDNPYDQIIKRCLGRWGIIPGLAVPQNPSQGRAA